MFCLAAIRTWRHADRRKNCVLLVNHKAKPIYRWRRHCFPTRPNRSVCQYTPSIMRMALYTWTNPSIFAKAEDQAGFRKVCYVGVRVERSQAQATPLAPKPSNMVSAYSWLSPISRAPQVVDASLTLLLYCAFIRRCCEA